jgi:MoaA/NifB/PqqE/SkfB family radical SAM enzyme
VHGIGTLHDQITGAKNAFKRVCKAIDHALSQGCKVAINTVVIPQNVDLLEKIYDYFKKFNLTYHAFHLVNFPDKREFLEKQKKIFEIYPKYLEFLKKIPRKKRFLSFGMYDMLEKEKKIL